MMSSPTDYMSTKAFEKANYERASRVRGMLCSVNWGVLLVNDPHSGDDRRYLDHLSNEEIHVHITVEIRRVQRQAVIHHRVERPAAWQAPDHDWKRKVSETRCRSITRRNTTGPPSRAAPWWVTLHMRRCYRRRQTPATVTSLARLHDV